MPVGPVSSELQKNARNELGDVPSCVWEDVQYIQEWLSKQPHLHARTDDKWILTFLRGCKFSLERTKEKLDLFYTMRTLVPEFFSKRDPFLPEIQEYLKMGAFLPLPNTLDSDEPEIILFRSSVTDPEKVPFVSASKAALMIIDAVFNDRSTSTAGQHVLIDLKDIPYKYLAQMTPPILKKLVICIQNAYPTRLKGIHVINMPPFYITVLNVIKLFCTEKMRRRIYLYDKNNINDLYRVIPVSVLPKEYGGNGESIDKIAAEWKLKVENYRDWFLEDEKYCSDESKRPGKPVTSSHMFGVEGSFKKLMVD